MLLTQTNVFMPFNYVSKRYSKKILDKSKRNGEIVELVRINIQK